MPSTYSTSLRIELQADGENASTWGQKANNDFNLFEQAIAGRVAVSIAGGVDVTLTATNGASDQSRNAVIELTGLMTASFNVIVPTATKLWLFYNNTTGAFVPTVKTAAGTGIAVQQGTKRWLYCDGTNVVDALSSYLTASSAVTLTAIPLTISSTTAGASTETALRLLRNKGAGVASDFLETLAFSGMSNSAVQRDYAALLAQIVGAGNGAENGLLALQTIRAGTLATRALVGAGFYTPSVTDPGADAIGAVNLFATSTVAGDLVTATSTDAGAAQGPVFAAFRDSASPAAADVLGGFAWDGRSSTAVKRRVAQQLAILDTATNAAEDAHLIWQVMRAGSSVTRLALGAGLYSPGATGTDKGLDTANFGTIYQNGVLVQTVGKQTMDLPAGSWTKNTTTPPTSSQSESTTNKVNRGTLDFPSGSKTIATANIAMPKSWDGGTLTFKVHFENTVGSNNIVFGMQILALRSGDTIDTAFGTAVETTTAVSSATALLVSAESSAVTPGGTVGSGCMLNIQFYRKGTGADTNTGNAKIWLVQIFYTTNAATDA